MEMITVFAVIVAAVLTVAIILKGRGKKPTLNYPFPAEALQPPPDYPDLKFAVISDPHYYDPTLGIEDAAFEAYMLTDRKLLPESRELLELAIDEIIASDAELVLIPGDMTREGEALCHQGVIKALARLKDAGKKIYVVPGNHDINILHSAVRFEGERTFRVDTISAADFARLYHDFGYDEALSRDSASLSYTVALKENLWLVALDVCRYNENSAEVDQVGGRATQESLNWLAKILQAANQKQIAVIAMIHHGVVEHWPGQGRLHHEYLVEDYQRFNRLLAAYGVRLAFSGHYHSQDVAIADYGAEGFIFDIETGSLISPDCPIRLCSISENKLEVKSVNLIGKLRPETDFADQAANFMLKTLEMEVIKALRKYHVSLKDANQIAKHVAAAFAAHARGDEEQACRPPFNLEILSPWGRFIYSRQKNVVEGLWQNPGPADLNLTLKLSPDR
jgi:predicted MPP superfamily phosphohydrolase